jgi:hypothetical protein
VAESDDVRASARRHTSQLLKMLRGYGPPAAPVPAAAPAATTPGKPAGAVAEAAPGYARRPEPMPSRQDVPDKSSRSSESPTVSPQRVAKSAIPTVGEALSRQRGPLGELMARADRLVRLSRIFRAYLPPHLRDHAVLIRLDEDGWVVHADSSSWATRLRYALHNIRETLGQELGFALPKPHIRVVPRRAAASVPTPDDADRAERQIAGSRRPQFVRRAAERGLAAVGGLRRSGPGSARTRPVASRLPGEAGQNTSRSRAVRGQLGRMVRSGNGRIAGARSTVYLGGRSRRSLLPRTGPCFTRIEATVSKFWPTA